MRLTLNGFSGSGKTFLKSFIIRGCLEGRDCLHRRCCGCFFLEIYGDSPQVMRSPVSLSPDSICLLLLGIQVSIPRGSEIAEFGTSVSPWFHWHFHLGGPPWGRPEALQKLECQTGSKMPSPKWRFLSDLWGAPKSPKFWVKLIRLASKYVTQTPSFFRFLWTAHERGGSLWTKSHEIFSSFTFAQLNWGQWRLNSKSPTQLWL